MKFSTSLLIGLFLASAADASLRTNTFLGRKLVNGMQYPTYGSTGNLGPVFGPPLATTQTEATQTLSFSNPLAMTFGTNSFLSKALNRIKEKDRALSKSKPSLYSVPDIKYVLLDQQGQEFKLDADSRNLATKLFADLERCKAENDVKNARALLEEIFRWLDENGLTLHVGINGTPMRSVTKDNMITALGAPELPIDMFKKFIFDDDPERNPSQKAALTGMDFVGISSQNAYVTNPESAALAIEPAPNDVIDKPLSLVLINNQGEKVKIATESVDRSVSELKHLIQTNNFFKWLEENQLKLYASLNGGQLHPVNGDEFISFFGNPRSNFLMIENSESGAKAETEPEEYDVILEAIRGLFNDKKEESVENKPDKPVVPAGNSVPLNPGDIQNVNNETSAAASTMISEGTLLADPSKSKFPWNVLMLSAGGLALVAVIVSAVYIASQTDQDEESVDL